MQFRQSLEAIHLARPSAAHRLCDGLPGDYDERLMGSLLGRGVGSSVRPLGSGLSPRRRAASAARPWGRQVSPSIGATALGNRVRCYLMGCRDAIDPDELVARVKLQASRMLDP